MILLDTDIMVDILREMPNAIQWLELESQGGEEIRLPGFVVLELIHGCRNKIELNRVLKFASAIPLHWPDTEDCNRALSACVNYYLSHHVTPFDALIGESAVGADARLYTFNVKHFRMISNLVTEQPYSRA